jgi:TPR repeat protein
MSDTEHDPIDPTGAFAKARFDRKLLKAEEGDADAQYDLGCEYMTSSKFVEKDFEKAAEWLGKATRQGHKLAFKALDQLKSIVRSENVKEEEPDDSDMDVCKMCLSGEIEMSCEVCTYGEREQ